VSRPSLFEQHSEAVLAAIKDGASIPDAARGADIGAPTVSGWLSRDRKEPTSKYGSFAARVDTALTERKLPAKSDQPADRDELLLLASRASRAGNVQAMTLLSSRSERPEAAFPAIDPGGASGGNPSPTLRSLDGAIPRGSSD